MQLVSYTSLTPTSSFGFFTRNRMWFGSDGLRIQTLSNKFVLSLFFTSLTRAFIFSYSMLAKSVSLCGLLQICRGLCGLCFDLIFGLMRQIRASALKQLNGM